VTALQVAVHLRAAVVSGLQTAENAIIRGLARGRDDTYVVVALDKSFSMWTAGFRLHIAAERLGSAGRQCFFHSHTVLVRCH